MEDNKRARVIISGRVQGVFFRMETKRFADGIGVLGSVKNRKDGKVEAVFEGTYDLVKKAVNWCHQGPPLSNVRNVDVVWESFTGEFKSFDIVF